MGLEDIRAKVSCFHWQSDLRLPIPVNQTPHLKNSNSFAAITTRLLAFPVFPTSSMRSCRSWKEACRSMPVAMRRSKSPAGRWISPCGHSVSEEATSILRPSMMESRHFKRLATFAELTPENYLALFIGTRPRER